VKQFFTTILAVKKGHQTNKNLIGKIGKIWKSPWGNLNSLNKTAISPLKQVISNPIFGFFFIFQPSIFRGKFAVSFREGSWVQKEKFHAEVASRLFSFRFRRNW